MSTVIGTRRPPKRMRHLVGLPDDVMHLIFSKLIFKEKISSGLVCKRWDKLLKAGSAGGRHWVVDYHVTVQVLRAARLQSNRDPAEESLTAATERWFVNRAGAIKSVHVIAHWISGTEGAAAPEISGPEGVAARELLETQLPFLAGYLSRHGCLLHLTFYLESPIKSPLFSSSAFLALLAPMVKSLTLDQIRDAVSPAEFAAICHLSGLETLHIYTSEDDDDDDDDDDDADDVGLQELTSDISRLVNLKTLILLGNPKLRSIPESISCLQKLECFYIALSQCSELPAGLGKLANLKTLVVSNSGNGLRVVPNIEGLKSLTSVSLIHCNLESIPKGLDGLSALRSLDVGYSDFESREGWSWWPTTSARLTQLAQLNLKECGIVSLPPHISALAQLTKLDISCNKLRGLPTEMSSLGKLQELLLHDNYLKEAPVSVLRQLTALRTIDLSVNCHYHNFEEHLVFQVPSSLLPILHPGLGMLDLRQKLRNLAHPHRWDPTSLFHLGRAVSEVSDRIPVPEVRFRT